MLTSLTYANADGTRMGDWIRFITSGFLIGLVLLVGLVKLFPFVPVSGQPIPGETWRATTHGDGVVTLDRERKLLRIDVDALPQDFLICIGAVCKLPAEWRGVK